MADTTFVDYAGPPIMAAWLNDVNRLTYKMTSTGDMLFQSGGAPQRLSIGGSNQVLTVVGGVPTWQNSAAGFANPMTTLGDLITGGALGVGGRLGIGTNGQVLSVVGGVPAWAAAGGGGGGDVTGPASSVNLRIATFNGTTGKIIQDSGTLVSDLATTASVALKANIASPTFTGTVGGITASMVGLGSVTNNAQLRSPGAVTSGRIVAFSGTSGEVVADSGILAADVVTGPASSVNLRVAVMSGTSGKVIADGGTLLSALATLASPTFTGTVGGITATMVGLGSVTNNAQLRSPGAVTSGRTVVFSGTSGEVVVQASRLEADLVAGPASSTSGNIPSFNGTGGKTLQDSGVAISSLASNPMTTSQDIIVGGASGTPTRLAVGANGTFLGVIAGAVVWTTPAGSGDVVGPSSSVTDRVASFNGTTGKLLQDSGYLTTNLMTMTAAAAAADRILTSQSTNKTAQDSGILITNVPTMASAAAASGNVITSAGVNKTQQDSGVALTNIPTMASAAGASGRVITSAGANKTQQDSGVLLSALATLASPTFTGTVGGITATMVGLGSVTNNAQLRSPGAVTSGRTVVFSGTTGEVVAQSTRLEADLVAGPASVATTLNIAVFNGTGGKTIQDGGVTVASLAPLASPTFTGNPLAPTPSVGDNDTSIATTAFVQGERAPRVQTTASTATLTPVGTAALPDDICTVTAQAAAINIANPSGTSAEGQGLVIRLKDNGTARAITYGTEYRAMGTPLPSTTVISKTMYLGFIRNVTDTKWDLVSVAQET